MTNPNYTNTPTPTISPRMGRLPSTASSSFVTFATFVTLATSGFYPHSKNLIENSSISNVSIKAPLNDTLTSLGNILLETETYNEWVEDNIVFELPPRTTLALELEIESVQRAEPKIVIPQWLIDESDV